RRAPRATRRHRSRPALAGAGGCAPFSAASWTPRQAAGAALPQPPLGGRGQRGFEWVALGTCGHARRGGRGFARALGRNNAANGDCSDCRTIGFDVDRAWLARFARNAFALEISPGAVE